MSGLFSDLHNGIRMPDVVMNQGPTPSQSMPAGFTTDSQINYGSTLLGDLSPYSYGAPSRLADQTAYMAVPHRIQKIVPELRLPEARNTDNTFLLSHGVDDGDVAFSLRVNRSASTIDRMHTFERMELSHVVDPFVNLPTVNYLLAGIQRYWNEPERVKWQQFMVDTDFIGSATSAKTEFTVRDALRFINDVARPFGIANGSEKQGGTHEGSMGPVTYPVNFITTLVVGGRTENLVNMWRDSNMSAGDDLILHLAWLPYSTVDGQLEYVLNHWRKGMVRQRFDYDPKGRNWGWQLVPAVYCMHPPACIHEGYDWREHGYWHLARTQVMRASEITQKLEQQGKVQQCYHDDSRFMRGALLEITFEPTFIRLRRPQKAARRTITYRGPGRCLVSQAESVASAPVVESAPAAPVARPAKTSRKGAKQVGLRAAPVDTDAAPQPI